MPSAANSLHVVTPVSRPQGLSRLYESLSCGLSKTPWCWWVIFDRRCPLLPQPESWENIAYWGYGPDKTGGVGYAQRNWAIDRIESGWIYFLDDDNLLHPRLESEWLAAREAFPEAVWFIFRQVRADGRLYLQPAEHPRSGTIDVGQVLIRREVFGEARFEEDCYDADGRLFARLAESVPPVCIDREAAYYNALRPT